MSTKLYRHYPVVVDNSEIHANIFLLDQCGFDIILGIDW